MHGEVISEDCKGHGNQVILRDRIFSELQCSNARKRMHKKGEETISVHALGNVAGSCHCLAKKLKLKIEEQAEILGE